MAEIPKIVSQRLQAMAKIEEHPEPNLLCAFAERSLGQRERLQILGHLTQCANCREIVSLAAVQPETAGAAAVVPVSTGWLSWPVLRWGALVACVVIVGAVVTLRPKHEAPPIPASIAGEQSAVGIPLPAQDSASGKKIASLQLPKSEAKAALAKEPPSPVEIADARTASPFAGMVPGRAKDASAELQGAPAEKAVGGAAARKSAAVGNALIPANLVPRWTLSSDGTLQRSLDSGRSWETIQVSIETVFRALAANGLDIWVGGSGGALFHSSDAGQHWTQVQPVADGETLLDDIIGVEFMDSLQGKLTTSNEDTWTTVDAGQTWQKQ
jgi:photosynthesis system II assembly factor YCF48-like protein